MLNNTVYTIDFEIYSEKKDSLKVYKTARKVFFAGFSFPGQVGFFEQFFPKFGSKFDKFEKKYKY